jgi:hypothetical protein
MKAYEMIISKQQMWAFQHDKNLQGSKGERGRKLRTMTLEENLFQPLTPQAEKAFKEGDGQELSQDGGDPCKMQAVHSSSALSVNAFQYWQSIHEVPAIAEACGLCNATNLASEEIRFEIKYPIIETERFQPNIDVVIVNRRESRFTVFAIECKFSEAYAPRKGERGLKPKYLNLSKEWQDIPTIHKLARTLSPEDHTFTFLHPAQLIKHILGLKKAYSKRAFRLLYLWYDAFGEEGAKHREEVNRFSDIAKKDGILFHQLTYQELLIRLFDKYGSESKHKQYISYLCGRYL